MTPQLISIIIPCYNYGRFLSEAVNSVLRQTYLHWECCIIDDGSTDDTKQIAEALAGADPRIRYHYKANGGLSSARNYGIRVSSGAYVCFLDADDLLDARKLQEQLSCFIKHPQADIVYGRAMFFEKNNIKTLYHNKQKSGPSELSVFSGKGKRLIQLLVKGNLTVVSTPLIKRSVIEKVGDFDEGYRSYEDWQFWFRCALADCEFKYCDQPPVCTYIRFGHESMMSDTLKLVVAGVQLRRYIAPLLPLKLRFYNYYRLLKLQVKLRTL